MEITTLLSYFFIVVAGLASLGILRTKNLLYAAFLLVLTMFSLAGIYVLLNAEFVAIAQIMIYVGGVLVLVVFAIMLSQKYKGQTLHIAKHNLGLASLIVFAFVALSYLVASPFIKKVHISDGSNSIESLGVDLISNNLIAFELVAFLLLVALIGALYFAGKMKTK